MVKHKTLHEFTLSLTLFVIVVYLVGDVFGCCYTGCRLWTGSWCCLWLAHCCFQDAIVSRGDKSLGGRGGGTTFSGKEMWSGRQSCLWHGQEGLCTQLSLVNTECLHSDRLQSPILSACICNKGNTTLVMLETTPIRFLVKLFLLNVTKRSDNQLELLTYCC